jgi:cytoskeletal protein CcmA (bactofilin family)
MFSKGKKSSNGSAGTASMPSATASSSSGLNGAAPSRRASGGVPSIISADLTIEGNLISHGDVQIDGTVDGDIRSRTLTLGEHAQVKGGVQAETVRICGTVEGEVRAKTVVLTKTAKVTGDIVHESLAIEAGAYVDGHCRREEPARDAMLGVTGGASYGEPKALEAQPSPGTAEPGKADPVPSGEAKAAQ